MVLSDAQIPWHDKAVLDELVAPFIKALKPHGIVLNGDWIDCYAISTFDKNPDHADWTLKTERDIAQEYMEQWQGIEEKHWIAGNHEDRWRRIAWKNPTLKGMLKTLPEFLEVKKYGFQWREYGECLMLGKLTVTHGDFVRKHSGASGMATFERMGTSVLVGHTHRMGVYYRTDVRGMHGAWENGCLCSLNPEYEHFPNWQQGFSVVNVFPRGMFSVQQIPIINRQLLIYGGKTWERDKS